MGAAHREVAQYRSDLTDDGCRVTAPELELQSCRRAGSSVPSGTGHWGFPTKYEMALPNWSNRCI